MTHRSANKVFWLTVMGSSMLCAIPQTARAQEAPAAQFRPVKTWEVGNKGAPGECIIQTEFNNGFILQFEGASNWVQALNVNFRQNVFEADKTYGVKMSVPGKTAFQTQAKGVKENILAVPVKTQKELYKAMREAAVLDMDVEGNAFRFYMTGFTDAAAQFERCMGGQSPQSQTQMVTALPPVTPPAPVDAPSATPADTNEETIVVRLSDEQKTAIEQEFMINESIEMEQQEAGLVDVEEIIPPAPPPVAEEPAPTPVIEEDIKVELTDADMAPPVAKMPEGNQSHVRLSDQLARQLESNPELAAIDNQPVARPEPIEREPIVIANPDLDDMVTSAERPDAKPDGLEIPEEIITKVEEAPIAEPETVEVEVTPVPEPLVEAAAPTSITTNTGVTLPDDAPDIVKQMFAQKQMAAPAPAPITESELTEADMPGTEMTPPAMEEIEVTMIEEPREVATIEAAEPIMPEPTAEPLIVDMEDEKPVTPPRVTTEDMLDEPAQKVTSQTPSMKVTKETTTAEFDMTNVERSAAERGYSAADLARIATLEQKIDALMAENKALNDELNASLREGEKERMSISSENWNLEKATMLYNEAERQNKSLGLQIQKERAQHEMEKKELEAMLFDPEVTSREQLARLSALERELAALRAELAKAKAASGQ